MQDIIIEKPYRFVPPHRGDRWPTFIQRFRFYDRFLKKTEGVDEFECRHVDRLRESLAAGHGILMTPNHCRTSDPLVMGFLCRQTPCHVFAMASWHLFNQDRFTAWAIRKMGGFSVNREATDRQSLNTSIDILEQAHRPLVIFPEGVTTRTNDQLHAMLDGVAFVARTAAKRRRKHSPSGKVVIHPIAIKYLFKEDLLSAVDPVLTEFENRLTWQPQNNLPLVKRIVKLTGALLCLKEIEYFGRVQTGGTQERLDRLIDRLFSPLEVEWLGGAQSDKGVVARVKALRMKIVPDMVHGKVSPLERGRRWRQLGDIYLAQQVSCYLPEYLRERPSVDRLLETVERLDEDLTDRVRVVGMRKVVLEVGEAIEVSSERDRNAEVDPLMETIRSGLQDMLDALALESRVWEDHSVQDAVTAPDAPQLRQPTCEAS